MTDLAGVEAAIGVSFRNPELLQQAFLHASYINEHSEDGLESNERLEFLGDAVLDCIVSEELYRRFPGFPEGALSVQRASLVSGERLAEVARSLGLSSYLYLGAGEERSGGRDRDSTLADTVEAVVGAVFLDRGYTRCQALVQDLLGPYLHALEEAGAPQDPKSQLQQTLQAAAGPLPVYRTVREEGPEHNRIFTVEVSAGGQVLGFGRGRRKALAERDAALDALRHLETQVGAQLTGK